MGSASSGLKVAIMTDERGWHCRQLRQALAARGASGRCIDLASCRFDSMSRHGLVIPGFGVDLPDAVIVRGIAGGSFEQVTLRLGLLHALRELGVPVYNDARAIERSVDKAMTSFLLGRAGITTPPAWATEDLASARRRLIREQAAGHGLVLKPLFGSQGKGLQRLGARTLADTPADTPANSPANSPTDAPGATTGPSTLAAVAASPYRGVACLQRFVDPPGGPGPGGGASFDWRCLVVGGQVIASMRRVSEHWIHNVAQGAHCEAAVPPPAVTDLAVAATAALGLDYAGVDLLPLDADGSTATVIEVNGVAAWRGLQSVSTMDIAARIVDDLLDRRLGPGRAVDPATLPATTPTTVPAAASPVPTRDAA